MVAYCKANGKQYADYKAAFTTFCINDKAKREKKSQNQFNASSFEYEPPGGFETTTTEINANLMNTEI